MLCGTAFYFNNKTGSFLLLINTSDLFIHDHIILASHILKTTSKERCVCTPFSDVQVTAERGSLSLDERASGYMCGLR